MSNVIPFNTRQVELLGSDAQTAAIVKAVVDGVVGELEKRHQQLGAMVESLSQRLDAYVIGDASVAVASVTHGPSHDVPNLSSFRAEATVVYNAKSV